MKISKYALGMAVLGMCASGAAFAQFTMSGSTSTTTTTTTTTAAPAPAPVPAPKHARAEPRGERKTAAATAPRLGTIRLAIAPWLTLSTTTLSMWYPVAGVIVNNRAEP